jgi:hypothetical protein
MGTGSEEHVRDDTPMLVPMVTELILNGNLSAGRRVRLKERLDAYSAALFWLAGGLAAASAELAGLIPPYGQPFEPDDTDPAPIDPEAGP